MFILKIKAKFLEARHVGVCLQSQLYGRLEKGGLWFEASPSKNKLDVFVHFCNPGYVGIGGRLTLGKKHKTLSEK
jgi:hypothetical protein